MSLNTTSTFDKPRLFSSSISDQATTPCNFITFLAAAQKLGVSFLPITWQSKRPSLGEGGTSQIGQALMNLQTSFAFKRVSEKDKLGKSEEEILRRCINEITVLWHPAIRNHPNILELQGLCWEICSTAQVSAEATPPPSPNHETVWPVLVFEKSHLEDLYHFARLPIGQELGIRDRLKICLDIDIVHGDIKPQNVLVFQDSTGSLTTKVADFGFSTWYARDDTRIILPRSPPWYAPECDEYPDFTPAQAVKTDVFSFGLLCAWFLFERYLSGALPLPEAAQLERPPYTYEGEERALKLLGDLKRTDSLTRLANQLVLAEEALDAVTSQMLQNFFSGCLVSDPALRDVDIQHSLKHMDIYGMKPVTRVPVEIPSLSVDDFKISASMFSFYSSDYRLRSYIRRQLERIVANDLTDALSIQLAVCYELGFGCPDNHGQPKSFTDEEIRVHIAAALKSETKRESGNVYNNLVLRGHHAPIDLADYYGETRVLGQAERTTRKDIERTTHALGAGDPVVLHLKYVLYSIMDYQGRWNESEKLKIEVLEIHQKMLGREHPDTLISMAHLAFTYSNRGQ
ncbi:putative serine/threonine-protein kinase roco5 [Metarhizium anisopliae]|nr:putative serine/threonine-protein kinase roco5 [Metarhizium anisopliae]